MWWFYAFGGGFVFGVYPLFLRARGLTELETNSVLATYFLMTFLTDVPTGAFADALSRRKAFVLGCALRTIAFGLYFFAHHYLLFLIGESIDAIGTTFGNGAIDAWAVDALDTAGFTGGKDRIFSRMSQLTNTGWLLSAMVGAYVANVNIAWPWILGSAGYLISLFVGAALMRGERGRGPARVGLYSLVAEIGGRTKAGLQQGFNSRPVLLLAMANAIQVASWAPYFMEWPQYFHENLGVAIWMIGWIYCLYSIGRLIGAELIARIQPGRASRALLLAGLSLGNGALLLSAGLNGNLRVMLAMLFLMNMCGGAMQPVAQSLDQRASGGAQSRDPAVVSKHVCDLRRSFGSVVVRMGCRPPRTAGCVGRGRNDRIRSRDLVLEAARRKGRGAGSDRARGRQSGRLAPRY